MIKDVFIDGKKKYRFDRVMDLDPDIIISLGGRNIGKSFAYKMDKALMDYMTLGEDHKFIIVRRMYEDTKQSKSELYFENKAAKKFVKKITKGEWEGITAWRERWWFYKMDGYKKVRSPFYIGYIMALSASAHYKSLAYEDVSNIFWDEMIPDDGIYLNDEAKRIYSIYSTVKRDRKDVLLICAGNTINRVIPVIQDWGLEDNLRTLKPGDITVVAVNFGEYDKDGRPVYKRIALEYCKEIDVPEGADIDNIKDGSIKMAVTGQWQRNNYPKLAEDIARGLDPLGWILFTFNEFRFRLKLVEYGSGFAWYVKEIGKGEYSIDKKIERAVGNDLDMRRVWTMKFTPLNQQEARAFKLFDSGSVVFNNDLTGEDFYNCLKQLNKLSNMGK